LDKKKPFLSYTFASLPDRQLLIALASPASLAVSASRRVKRRLALLASIQPRDNSAEGTPMAFGPCVVRFDQGSFPSIGYLSHAS